MISCYCDCQATAAPLRQSQFCQRVGEYIVEGFDNGMPNLLLNPFAFRPIFIQRSNLRIAQTWIIVARINDRDMWR
ncbi:Uncharacterised protein [Klebsiella grimontii]|uniref:Uncharacterized protein n=1 Tax=Klebsiella grimontii TaxID=2058152 RepID=A0A7H4P9I6_9ENTR|nr:Uncharacterised protein [Klebsiella grimontii]